MDTRWGTFIVPNPVDDYVLTSDALKDGIHILLAFVPGDDVDATAIGFVQLVRTLVGGAPYFPSDLVRARAIPRGDDGEGAFIDCDETDRNPVYGISLRGAGNALTDGVREHTDFGRRIPSNTDVASMNDDPYVRRIEGACSQVFETAAVALVGEQAGTYYGSVVWGWSRDAQDALNLSPIEVRGVDRPSETFGRAVARWNAAAAGDPIRPLRLPSYPSAAMRVADERVFAASEEEAP